MTKITPEVVEQMAKLGRLALTPEEIAASTKQLSGILEHFAAIQAIKTENVPPADDVTGLRSVMRKDEAKPEALCATNELLKNAPATEAGQVKVAAVF